MESSKHFLVNLESKSFVDSLSDEQAGKLFKHVFSFLSNENTLCNDIMLIDGYNRLGVKLQRQNSTKEIDFDKLIAYFNNAFKKATRVISEKAKANFKARLKEGYTKEDIVKVIDNCSNDNHHRDSNFKYVTLEFLSRPQIFERYASMEHQKQRQQGGFTNH